MAVKYDVIFKDGQKLSKDAICFGGMAHGNWGGSWGNRELAESDPANQKMIQFHTGAHLHPIWLDEDFTKVRRDWPNGGVGGREIQNANKQFLTELKLLVDDMPLLQDVLTIHPLVGVVRAHLKDHPADKIITSLMMVRNIANYCDMAASYRHWRSLGYRPRFSIILAHMFSKNVGPLSSTWSNASIGEYNWINPNQFGKQAFLQMMGHDADTAFDFIQQPWRVQRGYRRDNFYRRTDVSDFSPETGGLLVFDERMIYADGWDHNSNVPYGVRQMDIPNGYIPLLYTRNIIDCFSISHDDPICEEQGWNEVEGFGVIRGASQNDRYPLIERFISGCERVCEEAGISVRV